MRPGPGAIVTSSLIICTALSLFLYHISAGAYDPVVEQWSSPRADSQTTSAEIHHEDPPGTFGNQSDSETCAVSQRYPASILQWCGLITSYSQKRGLHPDLVAALIWQESGGNPNAFSHSGAVGLMQVMPSDGIAASFMCANGPCFKDRPSARQLKDPEFNISYGTKFLAGLVRRYGGNIREALKSYGPMDVGYYYADKVTGIFHRYGNP